MKLYIEDIRLRDNRKENPAIDGCIYVSIGDTWFPSHRWFDFVSADLENWIPRILSFAKGNTDSCTLVFLDGPYQLRLERNIAGEISAVCLEENRVIIKRHPVDFQAFLSSCAKAIATLATAIYQVDSLNQFEERISELGSVSKKLRLLAKL